MGRGRFEIAMDIISGVMELEEAAWHEAGFVNSASHLSAAFRCELMERRRPSMERALLYFNTCLGILTWSSGQFFFGEWQ